MYCRVRWHMAGVTCKTGCSDPRAGCHVRQGAVARGNFTHVVQGVVALWLVCVSHVRGKVATWLVHIDSSPVVG